MIMIGQTVSHYKILEKVGEGGMGEVYLAEDTKLKRQVALKFLPRQMTADPEARERFEREAQAAAALNHPNIVTVHEIGEHEGQVFIAMEYVEGQTLKDLISVGAIRESPSSGDLPLPITPRPLPITQVLDIASQIASGLAAAHAKGIVHRDIKPQNILVDKDGRVKILDFGLAKLKGVSSLTKESSTLGTIHYMSPEQTMGKDVDQRTDIWSLGVVLYEMLTGKLPFKGDYDQAVIYSILNEEPKKATEIRKDIPPEFDRILEKALAKESEDRYQHVDDLLVDLKHLKRDSRPDRQPAPAAPRRKTRRWTRWGIPAAVVLLAAIAAILFFIPKGKPGPAAKPAATEASQGEWTNSIAVLPFRDFSSKKDQEYFCNGMTDAIIGRLARIPELKVIATTSVMRYKDTTMDIKEIGRELQVETHPRGHAAEGGRPDPPQRPTDQRRNRLPPLGRHLRPQAGQDLRHPGRDLAGHRRGAADQAERGDPQRHEGRPDPQPEGLRALPARPEPGDRLSPLPPRSRLHRRRRQLPPGHRGRSQLRPGLLRAGLGVQQPPRGHRQRERIAPGAEILRGRLPARPEPVPRPTPAWAGCASPPATSTAPIAISAGPWPSTPTSCRSTTSSASSCRISGWPGRPCASSSASMQLDPAYFYSPYVKARILQMTGDFAGAEELLRRILRLVPDDPEALTGYVQLLIKTGRAEEAYPLLERAQKATPIEPIVQNLRALYWAARGDRKRALQSMPEPKATVYAMLGMKEEALGLMEKEIAAGKTYLYLDLLHNPLYDKLRAEPRFQAILRQQQSVHEERMRKYGNW